MMSVHIHARKVIIQPHPHQEIDVKIRRELKIALMLLDKRSREIIYKRYLSKSYIFYTLSNLSIIFNISKERIRQIEKLSISRLKEILN